MQIEVSCASEYPIYFIDTYNSTCIDAKAMLAYSSVFASVPPSTCTDCRGPSAMHRTSISTGRQTWA